MNDFFTTPLKPDTHYYTLLLWLSQGPSPSPQTLSRQGRGAFSPTPQLSGGRVAFSPFKGEGRGEGHAAVTPIPLREVQIERFDYPAALATLRELLRHAPQP